MDLRFENELKGVIVLAGVSELLFSGHVVRNAHKNLEA